MSIGSYVQFGIAGPMAHLYQFGNLWLMGSYIRNRILLSLSACSIRAKHMQNTTTWKT